MKVTFIIKKAAKRYDTESTATIYISSQELWCFSGTVWHLMSIAA